MADHFAGFEYDDVRRLYDLVGQIGALKATQLEGRPEVQARLAVAKAERDALQARGVPVLSSAELARARDRRDADLGRLDEKAAARVEARRGTDRGRRVR